ncbi:MAG: DUF4118 domain-containing protein, partial [Actinomycetota bacterium]|nr:DUF4118 domain-containing protein [Actinomycetota bacterium]
MNRLAFTDRPVWVGTGLGLALVGATTLILVPVRSEVSRATPALLLVLAVVLAGIASGARAAVFTAIFAAAVFNLAFIPPLGTFKVDSGEDWVALVVFVFVAFVVGILVAAETDRRRAA